jgi:hypothetical protein
MRAHPLGARQRESAGGAAVGVRFQGIPLLVGGLKREVAYFGMVNQTGNRYHEMKKNEEKEGVNHNRKYR